MGAVGTAETSVEGMTKTSIKGISETGVEGIVETGAVGAARGVIVGIVVSVATFSSSKVSVIRRIDIQNEWRLYQEVMQIHIKEKRKKKAMIKGEEKV